MDTITDQQAIRKVIDDWMKASKNRDTATVLSLMADDVIFMVPGQEPFGKEQFERISEAQKDMNVEGNAEIVELEIIGEYAYLRSFLSISITASGKPPSHKSGYTLTILKKGTDGKWRLFRDANLLV